MSTYVFDITVTVSYQTDASSEEEARRILTEDFRQDHNFVLDEGEVTLIEVY